MKKIKSLNSNSAVSEVVATILLLGIAVALFATLYIVILGEPLEANDPYPSTSTYVEGGNLVIEHTGGKELGIGSHIEYMIGGNTYFFTIDELLQGIDGAYLEEFKFDNKWNFGERIIIPYESSLENSIVDFIGTDSDGNRVSMTGMLDIFPENDIGIEVKISNDEPDVWDYIEVSIIVHNYRGDLNATNINLSFKLPAGLQYNYHDFIYGPEYSASGFSYDNESGFILIDKINVRDSVTLVINITVTDELISQDKTQLAMVLDGSGSISDSDWNIMTTGLANAIENESVFPREGYVELLVVQFGGNDWDRNWDDSSSNWYQGRTEHSGTYSATSGNYREGDFICDNFDTSGASSITVDFWYRLDDTEDADLVLEYYDGSAYDFIANIGGGAEDTWLHYTDSITDSQYFDSNFKIKFNSNLGDGSWDFSEYVYIDDVQIKKDSTVLLKDSFEDKAFARVEMGPVLITDISGDPGNYLDIANQVRSIEQMDGYTPIGCGLRLAADQLNDYGYLSHDDRQVINLVTDGMPNCEWIPDSTYSSIIKDDTDIGKTSTEVARDYMIDTLQMKEDQDEFDALAVGVGGMYGSPDTDWLNDSVVWPAPGYIAPPFDKGPGWVSTITTWQDFENSIVDMFIYQFGSVKTTVNLNKMDTRDPYSENDFHTIVINPQ